MNSQPTDNEAQALPQVGNPLLGQIHEFIDSDQAEQPALDPVGIVIRALRGRLLSSAALAFVVALLLGLVAWVVVPPVYQSLGMIRVMPKEAKILYADSDDSRLRLYDAFVTAEMQFLQSRPVLDHAVYLLDEQRGRLIDLPDDVSKVAGMLDVSNKKGLVSIAARSGNPLVAATVVNTVLDAYQAHNEEARQRQYAVRERELSERDQAMVATLQSLNEEYLRIGGEHDAGTLAKAHTAKTTQLEVIEGRIAEIDDTIAQLQATGGAGADVGDTEIQRATLLDNALSDMIYERARRLARIETLRMRFQTTHPELQAAERELIILEEAIAERRDQIATLGRAGALTVGSSDSAADSVADLERVRDRLLERRLSARAEATELNTRLVRIRSVAAEQKRVAELLEETKRALDEVRVENQNDLSRAIQIVARGGVAERPIENKAKPAALGGAVFGGLATMCGIVLLTVLQGRLRFSDDLEASRRDRLLAVAAENDEGLEQAAHRIRNELDLVASETSDPAFVISVVSTGADAGCSSLALALARAFGSAERRVLLAEFDRTGQSVSDRLQIQAEDGALNVARDGLSVRALLRPAGADESLDLLPIGTDRREHAQLLSSELSLDEFRHVLSQVPEEHPVVILDLGTLKAGRQSAIGAALADRTMLVVSAGQSQRELSTACDLLDRLVGKRYGIFFNRAPVGDPNVVVGEGRTEAATDKNPMLSRWLGRTED